MYTHIYRLERSVARAQQLAGMQMLLAFGCRMQGITVQSWVHKVARHSLAARPMMQRKRHIKTLQRSFIAAMCKALHHLLCMQLLRILHTWHTGAKVGAEVEHREFALFRVQKLMKRVEELEGHVGARESHPEGPAALRARVALRRAF